MYHHLLIIITYCIEGDARMYTQSNESGSVAMSGKTGPEDGDSGDRTPEMVTRLPPTPSETRMTAIRRPVVSRTVTDYATGPQAAQALDELITWRKTLGVRIRAATDGPDARRLRDCRTYLGRIIRELRTGTLPPWYVLAHAGPVEGAPTWQGVVARYDRADQWARAEVEADEAARARDVGDAS
jgi:hypothetical protein